MADVNPTCPVYTALPTQGSWDYREPEIGLFFGFTCFLGGEIATMARIHARTRGISASIRPFRKEAPEWSNTDTAAIEKVILDLKKEGVPSAKIGLILRDKYGVPSVKLATGKRIDEILKEKGIVAEIPEDLRNLIIKALRLRRHLAENTKDVHNKRQLNLTESKVRRLVKYYVKSGRLAKGWTYKPETAEILLSR